MSDEELLQEFKEFKQRAGIINRIEQRHKRDKAVYTECQRLLKKTGGKEKTAIVKKLMDKYGIKSNQTLYAILHRVEERLKETAE